MDEASTLAAPRAPALAAAADAAPAAATRRVRVWDLPTRLFHWALVAAVLVAVVSGQIGGDFMELHGIAGLAVLGLVVFRLVWGVVGPRQARFASFAPTPARLAAYGRGRWRGLGHTPLGALAVFALLGLLAAQAGTGLFSHDDIAFAGPLAAQVGDALVERLSGWHHRIADALLILVGLHVAAIAFYAWFKKHNLVGPMISGDKQVDAAQADDASEPQRRWGLRVALALALAAVAVYVAAGAGLGKHAPPPAAAATPVKTSTPAW